MRTTMTPVKITVQHADPGDDGWTHTLDAEDENGASVALLLSGDVFQQLWAACESPETVDGVWDKEAEQMAAGKARMK